MVEVVHYGRGRRNDEPLPKLIQTMQRIRQIDNEIARCEDNIAMCNSTKYRCTSKIASGPRGGARKCLEDIMQQETELRKQIAVLSAEKVKLMQIVSASAAASVLEPDEYKVLLLYYSGGYSLRQIAGVLYMSKGTVDNRKRTALEKLNNIAE